MRSLSGFFKDKSSTSTDATPSDLAKMRTFAQARSMIKRRLRNRNKNALSLEALSGTRGWSELPPQYSILTHWENSHVSRADSDPSQGDNEHTSRLPPSTPMPRYVDELDLLEDRTFSDRLQDRPDQIPEVRMILEAERPPSRLSTVTAWAPSHSTTVKTQQVSPDANQASCHRAVSSMALEPESPDESLLVSQGRGARDASRSSDFSDGSCDQFHPALIDVSPLSSGNATSISFPFLRALDQDKAHQLRQDRLKKFDADLAYTLQQEEWGPRHPGLPDLKTCHVCHEVMFPYEMPLFTPTAECNHPNSTCSHCLRRWIMGILDVRGWAGVTCPQCRSPLSSEEIRRGVLLRI